jgi:hypothetical protein
MGGGVVTALPGFAGNGSPVNGNVALFERTGEVAYRRDGLGEVSETPMYDRFALFVRSEES